MLYFRLFFVVLWLFATFGLGFLVCPFQWGNTNLNFYVARSFGKGALWLLGIKLEVEGLEDIEKHQPCVYAANHQGALDIASFGTLFPHHCVVIAKKEIIYVPILNLYYGAAGNIRIDRKNKSKAVAGLEKAVLAAKGRGASIWIFPEGTRNRTQEIMLPLKKGAAHMAIAAQIPMVPIVSSPIRSVFDWDRRKLYGGTIRMKVLPPISTKGLGPSDVDRLNETVRNAMMEAIRGLST